MEESIVFNIGNLEINSNHFFIKIRAIIIELFWNDNKKHLPILNKILFDDIYERDYEFAKLIYELGEKNECN